MKSWVFDESKHCGVDYADVEQAAAYDERHRKFRDYEKEFYGMLEFLGLDCTADKTVIDLGCGTGAAALLAAQAFREVFAVDVSAAMLERARAKNHGNGSNLTFVKGGFLTYCHSGEPVDLVLTKAALHHLPDFWKQIALLRVNRLLKPGGFLYIHDVVFQFPPELYREKINSWIAGLHVAAGDAIRAEAETHIRDEYSTFDWILRGMLANAGFAVEKKRCGDDFITEYACRKIREIDPEK